MSEHDEDGPAIEMLARTPQNMPPQQSAAQSAGAGSFDIGLDDSLGGDINYGQSDGAPDSSAPMPASPAWLANEDSAGVPPATNRAVKAEVSDWNAAMTSGDSLGFGNDLPTTNPNFVPPVQEKKGSSGKLLLAFGVLAVIAVGGAVAKNAYKSAKKRGGALAAPVERPQNVPACWTTDEGYHFVWHDVKVDKIADLPVDFRNEAHCKQEY